MIPEQGVDLK